MRTPWSPSALTCANAQRKKIYVRFRNTAGKKNYGGIRLGDLKKVNGITDSGGCKILDEPELDEPHKFRFPLPFLLCAKTKLKAQRRSSTRFMKQRNPSQETLSHDVGTETTQESISYYTAKNEDSNSFRAPRDIISERTSVRSWMFNHSYCREKHQSRSRRGPYYNHVK